ncbi:MAG: hypothetical protein ABJ308_08665 [Halieaceae bacterium]
MKHFSALLITCLLAAATVQASHLSEADVIALERACESQREKRLSVERPAAMQECVRRGEGDEAFCQERYRNYGERTTGGVRRLGKYYDLPECEEAYRARKHFNLNPGR